ncbi:MAG: SDR family NAD(P)-dependent oxidoreductase [Spirosomataceae bacterium]
MVPVASGWLSVNYLHDKVLVHILEWNAEQAQTVAAEIAHQGLKAQAHAVDVSNQAEVLRIINEIAQQQPIDILVNNAG